MLLRLWKRQLLLEFGDDLASFGKSSCLGLGENQLAIHDNIEDTVVAGDELGIHTKGVT